jgi:hypothetical protein
VEGMRSEAGYRAGQSPSGYRRRKSQESASWLLSTSRREGTSRLIIRHKEKVTYKVYEVSPSCIPKGSLSLETGQAVGKAVALFDLALGSAEATIARCSERYI